MLARLVPSLTGRPFTSLAASRSPTASGRATMCSTTRTRAKSTTPSFGRWLTNGFASCISAGKSAPRTTRTYTWKDSKNGAQFSPPCTCKQNDKNYGRHGSGDYPEAYSSPRVIHRSEESPKDLLPAASVNNSAAREKSLGMNGHTLSPDRENTHRPATNTEASHSMTQGSPSSRATRWSLTNTQWRTASISRSLYKPFAQDQPARF